MSLMLLTMSIALVAAWAAVLPGMLLVVRGNALVSDGIGHAVVAGIALGFIATHNVHSPLLLIMAVMVGVATVAGTEYVRSTGYLPYDAALGTVYPLFFSLGIILITLYARSVHLDIDMVILGDIVYAPFDRLVIAGRNLGPRALWMCGSLVILLGIAGYIVRHRLASVLFDEEFAQVQSLFPRRYVYASMVITSMVAVATFSVFGAIIVVGMMAIPPSVAYMWSSRLAHYVIGSIVVSSLGVIIGYQVAALADVSIIGSIATTLGCLWVLSVLVHPQRGYIAQLINRWTARSHPYDAAVYTLLRHHPRSIEKLSEILRWNSTATQRVINRLGRRKLIQLKDGEWQTISRQN